MSRSVSEILIGLLSSSSSSSSSSVFSPVADSVLVLSVFVFEPHEEEKQFPLLLFFLSLRLSWLQHLHTVRTHDPVFGSDPCCIPSHDHLPGNSQSPPSPHPFLTLSSPSETAGGISLH